MQEQKSGWFSNPITWALKKAIGAATYAANGVCNVASAGTGATATFMVQITSAASDFCFNVPDGGSPYFLTCLTEVIEANISTALEQDTKITATALYNCAETAYRYAKGYGQTALGADVCLLYWNGALNSNVNSTLTRIAPNGNWTPVDTLSLVIPIGSFLALMGAGGVGIYCIKKNRGRENAVKPTEHSALTSRDYKRSVTVHEH